MKDLKSGLHGLMTQDCPVILLECFWMPKYIPVPHITQEELCVQNIFSEVAPLPDSDVDQ
jgi:hypothetical protein